MARDFIFVHPNDINHAWFRYHFEAKEHPESSFLDGETCAFMDVLAKYQHENGGFGGLSDEFEYTGPCLKCTEIAIGYIFGLYEKPSCDHPVIKKTMDYLLKQYIPEIGNWGEPFVPEINEHPHCRWSRYRGDTPLHLSDDEERIKSYDANEKACFAAFIAAYSEIVPKELQDKIIKFPTQHALRYWDKNSPEYNKEMWSGSQSYDVGYMMWLVPHLKDKALADKLKIILLQEPAAGWELDFSKADNDYVHLPDASSPDDYVYAAEKKLIDEAITYQIKRQCGNGKWPLGWSYGDSEEMKKLEAKSDLMRTVNMLVKLKRFDRIEM